MAVICHRHCQLITDTADTAYEPTKIGADETDLYESYMTTAPDGTFFAVFQGVANSSVTFTFYQCNGDKITKSYSPEGQTISAVLTIPNVKRITVRGSGGLCAIGRWGYVLHHCRCCG